MSLQRLKRLSIDDNSILKILYQYHNKRGDKYWKTHKGLGWRDCMQSDPNLLKKKHRTRTELSWMTTSGRAVTNCGALLVPVLHAPIVPMKNENKNL